MMMIIIIIIIIIIINVYYMIHEPTPSPEALRGTEERRERWPSVPSSQAASGERTQTP